MLTGTETSCTDVGADSMLRAKRRFCAEQGGVPRLLHFICPLNTVSRLCRATSHLCHALSRLRHMPCRWLRHNFVRTFRIKYLQKIRLKICRVKRKSYLCTRNREDGKKEPLGALVQSVRIHACHAWGHGFESRTHRLLYGSLAQLNRASDYGSEGYRFESYRSHFSAP